MAQCNAAPKQSAPAVEQAATAAKQTNRVAKQADASLHDSTQKTAKPTFEVQSAPNDSSLVMQHISKALNNYPDVSDETRALVRAAADRLGYRPSALARGLKSGRTFNLGVLFDNSDGGLTHNYFSPVLEAFKSEAERRGYDIAFITHHLGSSPMTYLEHCRYRNVDGVCVVCASFYAPGKR